MTNVDTVQDRRRPAADGSSGGHDPVPAAVDWLLGILTGVIGLVLAAIGVDIYFRVDQAAIADVVADDNVQVNGLTESEFVTAAGPFVDWLAAGIVVTGLVCVLAAVAFVVARRRTRRRVAQEGGTTATFRACAVYGAVMTTLASFVPGSAVVGGGTAAYLHNGDSGIRTGAAAGLGSTVLAIPLVVFVAVGFIAGAGAIERLADGTLLAALVLVAELIALAINTSLGALGGFLAARLL
jgi:hypothetical protein